jgi:hypothetical protein
MTQELIDLRNSIIDDYLGNLPGGEDWNLGKR